MNSKLKPCVSAGLIALAAVVVLALYVGDSWIDPKLPAIIGAALILPISVIGALSIHPEANHGKRRFLVQLSTVAAAAIFGLGIPVLWAQPQVRSYAVERGPELLIDLRAALGDPVVAVSQLACHRILFDSSQTDRLVDSLQKKHPLAIACLDSAPQSANRNAVATKLRVHWHQTLVSQNPPAGTDACLNAQTLAKLPVDIGQRQADLFDCAVRAPENETRQCCATTLTALTNTCEDLAAQIDTKKLVDNNTISILGALSFGESTAEAEFSEVASFVDLYCPEMQAFALKLACVSNSELEGHSDTQRFLRWKFEQHLDCLDPEDLQEQVEVHQICGSLLDLAAKEATADRVAISSDMICSSHLAAIETNRKARKNVGGLDSEAGAALAAKINVGSNRDARKRADLKHWLDSAQGEPGTLGMDTFTPEDRRKIINQLMKNERTPEQMLNDSYEQIEQAQSSLSEKLSKHPDLKARIEAKTSVTNDAPSPDEISESIEENMKTLKENQKKAQDDLKKARH